MAIKRFSPFLLEEILPRGLLTGIVKGYVNLSSIKGLLRMLSPLLEEKAPDIVIPYQIKNTLDGTVRSALLEESQWESACQALEQGGVLYFPESPFALTAEDRHFLLSQKQLESPRHKNIAYRPQEDRVTGVKANSDIDLPRLHAVLQSYCYNVKTFMEQYFTPYSQHWQIDYTSFRPLEEQGRKLRLRARNDLLHVDSFPTRPTYGGRILRIFTNIHPTRVRVWKTSDTLEQLLQQFQSQVSPPASFKQATEAQQSMWMSLAKYFGFKRSYYSSYDRWMTQFHNFLKENKHFQAKCRKNTWEFPPGSSWMVLTDMVSHSVLSGQYALEQTFILALEDLQVPEKAPINLLKQAYCL